MTPTKEHPSEFRYILYGTRNVAIANIWRISCAHNMSRLSVVTLWPWI